MPRTKFDILKWCADGKAGKNGGACDTNVQYSKKVTGGNDPSITKAMRYAQYIRTTRPHQNTTGTQ